jgi:hypothetical protein
MKIDARVLIAPILAVLILLLIASETREALHLSGAWHKPQPARAVSADPFAPLDRTLASEPPPAPSGLRDPFSTATAAPVAARVDRTPARHKPPPPPPKPVLTSIVFDADPRATVRWDGRDYSVRAGTLFADFRVVSISRDQVVLDRNGESVILSLPRKGE